MVYDFDPRLGPESDDEGREDPDAGARQSVVEIVESAMLEDFLDRVEDFRREHPQARRIAAEVSRRLGVLPISYIPLVAREALSPAKTESPPQRMVRLSAPAAFRQALRHPEVTVADYRRAPHLVWTGAVELRGGGHELAFYQEYEDTWWRAVVRQTPKGSLYLTSLHAIERRQLPDEIHAATLLEEETPDSDDPRVREAVEALNRIPGVVSLSARTMRKQEIRHPELTSDEYRLLPDLLANGDIEQRTPGRVAFYAHLEGRWYRGVVTQSSAGRLYLIGFHRCSARHARNAHPQKPAKE